MALPQKLLRSLEDLGLTDKEAKVYLAMLSLSESNVRKIADAAEVKRSTVYFILDSLCQKGLVKLVIQGFKSYYTVESPEKLGTILDQRKKRLSETLPDFLALYNTENTQGFITYYSGLESVKRVYEQNLRDIRPREQYLVISNQEDWLALDPDYFESFTERRAKRNIRIRLLLTDSKSAREHKKRARQYNEKIRFLPKGTKLTTNVVITPKRLLMHQLIPPINGIVIENQSAIKTQTELFEVMWNASK